jgi:hypothetical protein
MIIVTRILVGLLGALFLLLAFGLWFNTDAEAAKLGLSGLSIAGHATVRADIAGFFLTGGGVAVYAAIKRKAALLWPVLLLVTAAIAGRFLTLVLNGGDSSSYPPMIVEAVAIILILYCQRSWPRAA